jgi:hypothetical protein
MRNLNLCFESSLFKSEFTRSGSRVPPGSPVSLQGPPFPSRVPRFPPGSPGSPLDSISTLLFCPRPALYVVKNEDPTTHRKMEEPNVVINVGATVSKQRWRRSDACPTPISLPTSVGGTDKTCAATAVSVRGCQSVSDRPI